MKAASGIMLTLLLISMLTLAFNIQTAKSDWTWTETIYIRANGSVDPDTAPISTVDNVTYKLTDNIVGDVPDYTSAIIVERSNITIDGSGYTLQRISGSQTNGFKLDSNNVTIKNTNIKGFYNGVYLNSALHSIISNNTITESSNSGIALIYSSNNTVSGNNITDNYMGVYLAYSSSNIISGNNITANNYYGIDINEYSSNIVSGNNIKYNGRGGVGLDDSSSNIISGNNITANNYYGIDMSNSSNNIIQRNNITDNDYGIRMIPSSSNNIISGNKIANHAQHGLLISYSSNNTVFGNNIIESEKGITLDNSSNNTISGNNITANNVYGIWLSGSSNNSIYHNNFVDNSQQVRSDGSINVWDDDYPSGGNYWSGYEDRYPDAEEIDESGIWDTPYIIDENNQDRYPLMNPWTHPEHDLVASITTPPFLQLGNSLSLNATVMNRGLSDEANVELVFLINGTIVDSINITLLQAGNSYTLTYLWTPTVEGTYNVTAYAHPVPGETSVENNQMTKFVTVAVSPPSEVRVGVEAGDWIKCDYTVTSWPSGTPFPEWLKVEILSVEGTSATVRVTMHMSDGTEQSDTLSVDVVAGGGTFDTLFGFVIPANCTTGDSIIMGGDGFTFNVTIDGETTRTYAGASRTVVYASFSQYGTELTYYWDKETGIMVEASTTSGGITGTAKATETNMWEAAPFWMQWWLWAIVAVVIVAFAGTVYFLKKRKPPTPTAPPTPPEGTTPISLPSLSSFT